MEACAKKAQGSPRQALVNLGACINCKSAEEARAILRSAEGQQGVINLCRLLVNHGGWGEAQSILADLKDQNGESIRQIVRDYMTKVILGAKSEKAAANAISILDEFSQPFHYQDGISPVILAVAKVLLQ